MTAAAVVPTVRRPLRVARTALVLGTVSAVGLLTSWWKLLDGTHAWWDLALSATSGLLFVVAGAVEEVRRPGSRVGLLMVLVALGGFAEDVQLAPGPVLHTVGLLLQGASTGVLAHLVLAFPSGELPSRADRVVVVAAYAWSGLVSPATTFFFGSPERNLLFRTSRPEVLDASAGLGVAVAVAVVVGLGRHWRASRPALRFVLTPVLVVSLAGSAASLAAAVLWGSGSGLYRPVVVVYQVTACLLPLAFLVGVLRIRLGRSGVSQLLPQLGRPVPPGELRALLRRALGDPGLVVAFPRADGSGLVDPEGAPVHVGTADRRVATDVLHDGRRVAVLLHDPALLDDEHVLRAVTAAAGLALENERLAAELRAQLGEVRRSRARIVGAQQREREVLERDLHDGVQATLVAALVALRTGRTAGDGGADGLLQHALEDLRRVSHGVRPAVLAESGLVPAVATLLDRSGLQTSLRADEAPALDPTVEDTLYFCAAEALANTLKHASARRSDVEVTRTAGGVRLVVHDDGRGGAAVGESGGLRGLADRVGAVDGTVRVDSPPGGGTRLQVDVPGGR